SVPEALVVAKDESLVLDNRAARRGAELIALPERLFQSGSVRKKVACVKLAVSQKFVNRAMQLIGPGADHGIYQRARAPPKLRRIRIGLDLELLERFYRGLDHLYVQPTKAVRVGCVVDPVELERILKRPIAVDVKYSPKPNRLQTRRGSQHARREERELVVIAPVQRQLDDLRMIDDRAAASGFRLEHWSFPSDADFLRNRSD